MRYVARLVVQVDADPLPIDRGLRAGLALTPSEDAARAAPSSRCGRQILGAVSSARFWPVPLMIAAP